ncbi:MAG: ArsR family transcriptional regulator [Patescibacteria group bacterium]|nr:ArsR family transcriptional regulator [Patescibacteria group bacterium]
MLGKLFGSNTRVKILKLFLLHPGEKYYIRQLARDLKLQVNSVRRELENLEEFGLLSSHTGAGEENALQKSQEEKQNMERLLRGEIVKSAVKKVDAVNAGGGEKKYYQANKNFVLFEEMKALVVKAQVLYEKDFIKKLNKIGSPKLFILTGVFINSQHAPTDMLIVGRINKDKLARTVRELEREMGRQINYTLMDTKEFKYRKDITDIFLYSILEGNKVVVVDELGVS